MARYVPIGGHGNKPDQHSSGPCQMNWDLAAGSTQSRNSLTSDPSQGKLERLEELEISQTFVYNSWIPNVIDVRLAFLANRCRICVPFKPSVLK